MGKNVKLLLLGDTIIDHNVFLSASGLSLESPTLKTNFLREEISFGGAANVAKYASLLGAEVTFITSIANKDYQNTFNNRYNIKTIFVPQEKVNVKKRFWVERGGTIYKYLQINDINPDEPQKTVSNLSVSMNDRNYDVAAISDYRCGLINQYLANSLKKLDCEKYAASQVSGKENNFQNYSGFDCLVMNSSEAIACTSKNDYTFEDFKNTKCERVLVTLGEDGAQIMSESIVKRYHLINKVPAKNIIGAGDAFYAALLASDGDVEYANDFASHYVSVPPGGNLNVEGFMNE